MIGPGHQRGVAWPQSQFLCLASHPLTAAALESLSFHPVPWQDDQRHLHPGRGLAVDLSMESMESMNYSSVDQTAVETP